MRYLFISDAHYPNSRKIIDFLLDNYTKYDVIYVLGDLFEFYYGYKNFFYPHHLAIINTLNIISQKTKVILFEGNHEYNLESIKEFFKVRIVKQHLETTIDGLVVYMEHGDVIDKKDKAYQTFRSFLKNRLTLSIVDKIKPSLLLFMSKIASNFSKKRLSNKKYRGVEEALEEFAKAKIESGTNVVIFAHTHKPLIKTIENGLYINCGEFFKKFSYVEYESGQGFTLKFLNAEDANE